ncbi:MAG: type II secretion system F family protein [Planctomycetaceae bacterium]|nr:type II secretion system F family protein [Planctomycetaceae bacterium]
MDNTIINLAQLVDVGEPLRTILFWSMGLLAIVLLFLVVSRVIRFALGAFQRLSGRDTDSELQEDQSGSDVDSEEQPFMVQSSKASAEQTGKKRSWTSQSLFGKSVVGAQRELPRLEPGELPITDDSDFVFGPVITSSLASAFPESQSKQQSIKKELIEAGHYEPHAWQNLAAIRYLGLMLPLLGFGAALVFLGNPRTEPLWLTAMVIGAAAGWALPRLMVRSQANRRRSEIEQSLPDVLDLLNMCVSQGLTIGTALSRVSWEITEVYPAMADELRIVTSQSDMDTLEHALTNMNDRVDLPELHSLSSLLIQTERMGTNVSDALTDYSDGMRATLQQRADQKASTATFKLLFPTVLCLMPAVYMFLLGPAVVELSDFFQGGGVSQFNQVDTDR